MYSKHIRTAWAVAEPVRESPVGVYLATLAPTGRRSMRIQLQLALQALRKRKTVEEFDWSRLSYADVIKVRAKLVEEGRSPHSINMALAGIRGTMKCAFHLGQVSAEQVMRIKSIRRLPVDSAPRGRSLSKEQVRKMLLGCRQDTSARGTRDGAMLALLICTGVRRSEASALMLEDYDTQQGIIRTRKAKQNRHRYCPLVRAARVYMAKWCKLRGGEIGPLFCRIGKSDNVIRRPLTGQSIYDIVKARASDVGVGQVTPHDLRRTFVTRLLISTGDINLVRSLVGHSNIETTARYDLRIHNAYHYIEKCRFL